jgi:signal transduction histidine kinase/GAF domain-containing protein
MDSPNGKQQAPLGEESNILERVARIIVSVRGAKPDYAHLAAELEPALPFDIFGIVLLRHDRQAVRVTACQKEGELWRASYHQHPLVDSMVARVAQLVTTGDISEKAPQDPLRVSREPTVADLLTWEFPEGATGLPAECGDALCGHPQLQSVLIAPLVAGNKLLGTLELGCVLLDAYRNPALKRLILAVVKVLATAIEGAQVGGNVEIQDRQRRELKDVSNVLSSSLDLQMILDRIVAGITNSLHVSSAIVRFDRRQSRLFLEAQSGLDSQALQSVLDQHQPLSERTIIGATLLHRQSRVSQDITQDRQFPESQRMGERLAARSIFCYPLLTGQYIYGALLLLSPEAGGFTPLKIDIFLLFAGQATVAIQNGLLLQSAEERRRFQEVIEQLERAHQQHFFAPQSEKDDEALFKHLRDETANAFGVSLGSLLRFISDHLLTRSERHLQDILRSINSEPLPARAFSTGNTYPFVAPQAEPDTILVHADDLAQMARASDLNGSRYLMDAADDALAHTDLLSDISSALLHTLNVDEAHPQAYEQMKQKLAEPWFIVDLNGTCLYLNRAAETFCDIHEKLRGTRTWENLPEENQALFSSFHLLPTYQESPLALEQVFESVLPRVRQLKELRAYLREFAVYHPEDGKIIGDEADSVPHPVFLRCTIAAEPLPGRLSHVYQGSQGENPGEQEYTCQEGEPEEPRAIIAPPASRVYAPPAMLLDSSPSDRHYQYVRYALYNNFGQWFANALYIHDITEQVRDEKNKTVLLASVSHDLRTPLTTIKAAVTGLLQPGVDWAEEDRREILAEIDAETDHLHTLVNALVEMSRIEMGALTLEKEWCDLVELLHSTLKHSQRLLADFVVQTSIQSPIPLIYADYAQLERVLYNLLENATRHSPRHSILQVHVDVLGQKDLPPGMPETVVRAVRLRVIDQGPGVPEEERERIFKTFYTLDPQGNGLGLSICRGIVEAHQGRIWVEAEDAGGACFVFVLPVHV